MAKFRAWDKKNKSFITNDDEFKEYMIGLDGKFYRMDFYSGVSGHENGNLIWNELKDIILMQYTGLKDKNGVDICEGDILKHIPTFEANYFVKNLTGGFYLCPNNKDYGEYFASLFAGYDNKNQCNSIEIIGNIYENTELMGGGK